MSTLIDIFLKIISYLPRLVSFWLYSPERTKNNIHFSVSAQEGSVEIWCDSPQSRFSLRVEVKNYNPFPIEIDRAIASGTLHNARLKAFDLIGVSLKRGEAKSLYLEGRVDEANLKKIRCSPSNATIRVNINAIIINKYHTIRSFSISFDRLMCKLTNKDV